MISRSPRTMPKGRFPGFTVIELLAVVAITGVIAALLIPAYNNAVSKANSAKCVENLHSWMTALHLYVPDNNGILPISKYTLGTNGVDVNAANYLWPYIGAKSYADAQNRFTCPVKQTKNGSTVNSWTYYGFNYSVSQMSLSAIPQPSRVIYATDIAGNQRWIDYNVIFGTAPQYLTQVVPKPHDGRINIAYLDGHVVSAYLSKVSRADFTRCGPDYKATQETVMEGSPAYDK